MIRGSKFGSLNHGSATGLDIPAATLFWSLSTPESGLVMLSVSFVGSDPTRDMQGSGLLLRKISIGAYSAGGNFLI
jgi:hypothetical protein